MFLLHLIVLYSIYNNVQILYKPVEMPALSFGTALCFFESDYLAFKRVAAGICIEQRKFEVMLIKCSLRNITISSPASHKYRSTPLVRGHLELNTI